MNKRIKQSPSVLYRRFSQSRLCTRIRNAENSTIYNYRTKNGCLLKAQYIITAPRLSPPELTVLNKYSN